MKFETVCSTCSPSFFCT